MVQMPVQNLPQTQIPQGQPPPAQPSAPSVPSVPSVSSKPFLPSLPSFPKPKLPPLKLPLVFVLVALIAVALGVFFAFNKSLFQKPQPSPSPLLEDHSKPPEKDLFAVNGRVISIDQQNKTFVIQSIKLNWSKQWNIKVGEKTVLATLDDWTSPTTSVPNRESLSPDELANLVPKKSFSDYKTGDIVYMIAASGQDFVKELGTFEPFAILLQ